MADKQLEKFDKQVELHKEEMKLAHITNKDVDSYLDIE